MIRLHSLRLCNTSTHDRFTVSVGQGPGTAPVGPPRGCDQGVGRADTSCGGLARAGGACVQAPLGVGGTDFLAAITLRTLAALRSRTLGALIPPKRAREDISKRVC